MENSKKITKFSGKYRFLSNFHTAKVEYEGLWFTTVEHAYQAAKTIDNLERRKIQSADTPGKAKRAGRHVSLRSDWEDIKLDIMHQLVEQKFTRHPYLMRCLQATNGRELIEGNTWGDTYWGECRGIGENHLGRILMEVRQKYGSES